MKRLLHDGLDFDQITVADPDGSGEIILVQTDGQVQAYRNSCPHVGVGLDYGDGHCLLEPGVLVCAMHGARFEATTGLCTDGPCRGQHLTRVPVEVVDGRIELA